MRACLLQHPKYQIGGGETHRRYVIGEKDIERGIRPHELPSNASFNDKPVYAASAYQHSIFRVP